MSGTTVYSLPIDEFGPALGYRIDGILGNEFISKVVAEIDYSGKTLTLYQPEAYSAPANADKVALQIDGGLPFIRAAVDVDGKRTIQGKMEIDTGSTGALLLNSPVVKKYGLTTTLSNYLDTKTGGVGGTGTSKIARLNAVSLGRSKIARPIAQLYTGTKGDNASTSYDGLLGGAIFRRFKMTVDMSRKQLLLEPNVLINEEFETDMSGLSLVADGGDLTSVLIDEVRPGSAAARAGIAESDVIVSINGRSGTTLQEVRKLFRTAGEYELTLKRGGKVVNVRLILKRVI
jgi:membrane-associated protease RseP (regulator of RpoE activity)